MIAAFVTFFTLGLLVGLSIGWLRWQAPRGFVR